jgi:hypothetical protein
MPLNPLPVFAVLHRLQEGFSFADASREVELHELLLHLATRAQL